MLSRRLTRALCLISLFSASKVALAAKAIPCAIGSGNDNGCSFCEADKAVEVTPWYSATRTDHFDLPNAASKVGGGYDVWWNIAQPDPGCRTIIAEPFNTDKGSTDARLSGNVILSVGHGGCYFAHVGSRGVSVGFCCGSGDCGMAGALPEGGKKQKRGSQFGSTAHSPKFSMPVGKRGWTNPNPEDPKPGVPPPKFQCSTPTPEGDTYTKSGPQQIDGQSLNCNGGETCSLSQDMAVSAATSLMNEDSSTYTDSMGFQFSMNAGFMFIGPTSTFTSGLTKDWSNAVTKATATTDTKTISKSLSLGINLVPGANFNVWFSPTLKCQSYRITCNNVKQKIEKCAPVLDSNGNPIGAHGVMTIA